MLHGVPECRVHHSGDSCSSITTAIATLQRTALLASTPGSIDDTFALHDTTCEESAHQALERNRTVTVRETKAAVLIIIFIHVILLAHPFCCLQSYCDVMACIA
jgi:hypothetical protein